VNRWVRNVTKGIHMMCIKLAVLRIHRRATCDGIGYDDTCPR
jgi:hypothetical protein